MAPKKTTRSTRTRAQLNDELETIRSAAADREILSPIEEAARASREAAIRAATANASVETSVKKITQVGLEIAKTLSSISEQVAAQVNELKSTQEAVELARKELEELHGKDVIASSLAQLIAEYDAREVELAAEYSNREAALRKNEADLRAQYGQLQRDLETARQREDADFQYKLQQARKAEQDKYNESVRVTKLNEEIRAQAFERDLAQRKANLQAQEQEVAVLKQQVAEFPAKLDAEVKRQTAIATSALKRDLTSEFTLEKKDLQTQLALKDAKIEALENELSGMNEMVGALQAELKAAREAVSGIATKALESASSTKTLGEMSLAMGVNAGVGQVNGTSRRG